MKCSKLAMMFAMSCALSASAASAQDNFGQRGAVESTAYEYGSYYAQDETPASPSDRPAPEAAAEATAAPAAAPCDSCGGCDSGCDSCCRRPLFCERPLECCEEDPWRLFECFNENNCHGVKIEGWLNGGMSWNDYGTPYNGTVTFNDRDDEFQMNQAYIYAEKGVDTEGCGWDLGGRVDLLYGTDSRFTQARGLELTGDNGNKWNSEPFYGLALPQAYAEVAYNDISVKLGHWYTIIGYEAVMAQPNFFYSHAYTMQYGEPFTHTGALATWTQSETTKVIGGFDRGWDNWEDDDDDRLNGIGGITWDGGEGLTVALTGTVGQEPGFNNVNDDRYMYSFVLSKQFTDRLSYVFQHDCGVQNSAVSATQDAEWYGINQYLFYKLNCCWTAGARFEWFRDDDGFRVAGIGDRVNGHPLGATRFAGDFYELTLGLNYSPTANLRIRPELRMDWFDGVTNNANVGPFDDGQATDQTMFAVDAIYLY